MSEIITEYTNTRVERLRRKLLIRRILSSSILLIIVFLILITFYKALHSRSRGKVIKPHTPSYIASASATQNKIVILNEDKRTKILKDFFDKNKSPLASSSAYFIEIADEYGLDWTLMPAITGMESNFGRAMPRGTNNPFGLGGKQFMTFLSIEEAIHYEGKLLSQSYKLAANSAIGSIYCPKYECNQNWAVIVTNFSEDILK
jgi:hypothetical protein